VTSLSGCHAGAGSTVGVRPCGRRGGGSGNAVQQHHVGGAFADADAGSRALPTWTVFHHPVEGRPKTPDPSPRPPGRVMSRALNGQTSHADAAVQAPVSSICTVAHGTLRRFSGHRMTRKERTHGGGKHFPTRRGFRARYPKAAVGSSRTQRVGGKSRVSRIVRCQTRSLGDDSSRTRKRHRRVLGVQLLDDVSSDGIDRVLTERVRSHSRFRCVVTSRRTSVRNRSDARGLPVAGRVRGIVDDLGGMPE